MKVIVVGAGLGGLSTACHLIGQGHEVTVVERASAPGGRAGTWQSRGYHFDTGPTVLTMTGLLNDVFRAAGSSVDDHLSLVPVDPMYRAVFPDGSEIRCRHGIDAMREEIAATCGRHDADGFVRFAEWLGRLYRLEMPNFIDRNFDSPLDLARPAKPIVDLVRLGGLRRLSSVVASYFDDTRLQRLFSFQSMYAGLSPFDALAVYAVITYMDAVEGVYFPLGGMHQVGVALADAAEKAGAQFRYSTAVEQIVRGPGRDGRVVGVRVDGGELLRADVVVANPDVPAVYRELLTDSPVRMPRVARRGEYSPSCLVWHAGAQGTFPRDAAHHNIHFGDQWREAFDALLRDGRPMPDPSILVTSPTHTDPSLAPDGRHVLYALEPMPNLDGAIDWTAEGARIRSRLTERVAAAGYPSHVEVERFVDPTDWERDGMERGTPFALSHRFLQTGPFRPANIDRRVPGLVLTGSGTVPGVGVPMVLLSGRLAAERVQQMGDGR